MCLHHAQEQEHAQNSAHRQDYHYHYHYFILAGAVAALVLDGPATIGLLAVKNVCRYTLPKAAIETTSSTLIYAYIYLRSTHIL